MTSIHPKTISGATTIAIAAILVACLALFATTAFASDDDDGPALYSDLSPTANESVTYTPHLKNVHAGVDSYQWQRSYDQGQTWENADETGSQTNTITTGSDAEYYDHLWFRGTYTQAGMQHIAQTHIVVDRVTQAITYSSHDRFLHHTATVPDSDTVETYQWQASSNLGKTWQDIPQSNVKDISVTRVPDHNPVWLRVTWIPEGGRRTFASNHVTLFAPDTATPVRYLDKDWQPVTQVHQLATVHGWPYRISGVSRYAWQIMLPKNHYWEFVPNSAEAADHGRIGAEYTVPAGNTHVPVGAKLRLIWEKNGQTYAAGSSITVAEPVKPKVTYTTPEATLSAGDTVAATFDDTAGIDNHQWQYSTSAGARWEDLKGYNDASFMTVYANARYRITWEKYGYRQAADTYVELTGVPTGFVYSGPTVAPSGQLSATLEDTTGVGAYTWAMSTDQGDTWEQAAPLTVLPTLQYAPGAIGAWVELHWVRGGVPERAYQHVEVTDQPSVQYTYDLTTPILYSVNATFSSQDGITDYQWQQSTDRGFTWRNSNLTGSSTRSLDPTNAPSGTTLFRIAWTRTGVSEHSPNHYTYVKTD